MRLKIISEDTLQDLRINYGAYSKHYYKQEVEWFKEYFSVADRVIETNVDFEMPIFNFNEDYSISDRENVKAIYSSLKQLSIIQATQERLWSGLAHLQFRDFTFYRLKNELKTENDKRINTAVFFKNGNKRSLFVHIIARLWWVGYMTYDEENRSNPFWLTDFFCEKDFSARCVVFFSSNFTANRNITLGILKAIIKLKNEGIDIKRDHFVQSTKYLNVIGGAMILDILTVDDVEQMVSTHLNKIFNLVQAENESEKYQLA